MLLGKPEEKRRMSWEMPQAHEVGLGKVVKLRLADLARSYFTRGASPLAGFPAYARCAGLAAYQA
jgi:hypothetical protein